MKPSLDRLPKVSTNLVRGGHLWESARFRTRFSKALNKLADKGAFKEVIRLPYEFDSWQVASRGFMEASRPAMDMTPEDEDFALMILNGDPNVSTLTHWHLRTACRCGGEKHFKQNMRKALAVSIGGGMPRCLLYRWKGFEKAASWMMRGRKQNDVLLQATEMMFNDNDIQDAHEAAKVAAAQGDQNHGANQCVRYGLFRDFLREDKGGHTITIAVTLNMPQQKYLNCVFEAEKAMRKYLQLTLYEERAPRPDPAAPISAQEADRRARLEAARAKARLCNVEIMFRINARKLACSLTTMLLAEDTSKSFPELTQAEVFNARNSVACALSSANYRLDFKYEHPKYEILLAAAAPFNEQALEEATWPLEEKSRRCAKCLGKFASKWLPRLRGVQKLKAHRFLRAALPAHALATIVVEHKHILGQDTHAQKKRGRSVSCIQLAARTYRKSVRQTMLREQQAALTEELPPWMRKKILSEALLSAAPTGRRRDRRARVDQLQGNRATRRINKPSAYHQFRSTVRQQGLRPGTPGAIAEEGRVSTLWAAMDGAQKQVYELKAKQLHDRSLQAMAEGAPPSDALGTVAGAWRARCVRRARARQVLERLRDCASIASGAAAQG